MELIVFFISITYTFYYFINEQIEAIGAIILMSIFAFFILVIFIAFIQYKMAKKEVINLKIHDQLLNEYVESLKQSQELLDNERKRTHDIKNNMLLIKMYAENNEMQKLKDYLQNNFDLYTASNGYFNTGNKLLDYVLLAKQSKMQQSGIKFISVVANNLSFIKDSDLIVLLGNLFDNAIEAECKILKNKFIQFETKYTILGDVLVKISNNNVDMKNEKLLTTKDDKDIHGYGIKNIKEIISKYDATFFIENSEIFEFRIMFKKEDN